MKPCKFRVKGENDKVSCDLGKPLGSCGMCAMRKPPGPWENRNAPVPTEAQNRTSGVLEANTGEALRSAPKTGCSSGKKATVG